MKNSPVDPDNTEELDEFFDQDVGIHALPDDESIDIDLTDEQNARLHELVAAEVKKRNDHPKLAQVTLSFEYVDGEGYSNWVNVNYYMREPDRDPLD